MSTIRQLPFRRGLAVSLLAASCMLPAANALTINLDFVDNGDTFPGTGGDVGTLAPTNTVGGGTLTGVVRAAADWWEDAITTAFTLDLNFGWAPRAGGVLATHNLVSQTGGANSRETEGTLRFDSDESVIFFLDPTPHEDEEFGPRIDQSANFADGPTNIARFFQATAGGVAAGVFDLLSIAKHEIGHALGLSNANQAFQATGGTININGSDVAFDGSHYDTDQGGLFDPSNALLSSTISSGRRVIQSELDILTVGAISNFAVNTNPQHTVPAPAAVALLLLGLAGLNRRKTA